MLRAILITLPLFCTILFSQVECDGTRYIEEIFQQVEVSQNITYGGNYNPNVWGQAQWVDLKMDIYAPAGDSYNNRPLVFFMFGGSFVAGDKTSPDIVELCTRYAKSGYVAAAIDYRLTTNLIWSANTETAYMAAAKAIHDLKSAIRYFRMDVENGNQFNIDPNRIYAGGVSAGGIAAVNAAYLNEEYELPGHLIDFMDENGGLEGNSGNEGYSSEFHGIINLCGAVGDPQWIIENDIPVVNVHGDEDSIVPYGDGLITLFGLNMQVYGSYVINETMLSLGNQSALHTFVGEDHTPFMGSSEAMDITIEFTRSFMYDLVCSENQELIGDLNGDDLVNIQDIIIMVNIILGVHEFDSAADLNGDSIVNVLDVIQLMNIILDS